MVLCKAMILIGALLLGPALQVRIKQASELTSHAELAEDASEDMEQSLQQSGKEQTHPKGERVMVQNEENKLVKGKGEAIQQGKGKVIRKAGEFPERKFRFPVLNGKWWIHRLAFMRGQFSGFVYQEVPATKTLLVKSWKAQEDFGDEAIIPLWGNYVGAKVGDKITFDVGTFAQEGEGKPRPMAMNVFIRERGHAIGTGLIMAPPPMDVRTQVLYYISDDNLRTDKFFQDIIAATEGGWISTDFLLLCRRIKQLGASSKSIVESLRDAPGVEVRDIPGEEAIRRKSAPPLMEPGTIARKDAVFPTLSIEAKKVFAAEMLKRMGDSSVENHMQEQLGWKELWEEVEGAEVEGPETDEPEAKGPELLQAKKDGPSETKRAAAKGMDKRKVEVDARRAKVKASAVANKEEKAKDRAKKAAVDKAAAKKAAAEKPAAKKVLAEERQDVEEQAAAALVKRSLQAAAAKATEEAAAAPGGTSGNGKSWGSWFTSWLS